jgi:hypothetical protein
MGVARFGEAEGKLHGRADAAVGPDQAQPVDLSRVAARRRARGQIGDMGLARRLAPGRVDAIGRALPEGQHRGPVPHLPDRAQDRPVVSRVHRP